MPGVNCSVLGCGSCRRSKRLEIVKESVKMKDPRILKYVSIALFSVELQRYAFTHSQQETTIAQVVQLSSLFGCFLRVLAFIFLAYLVIIPFVYVFLVHSTKMRKKKLRFGALPTNNMHRRSNDSKPPGWICYCIQQKRISEIACQKFNWNSRIVEVT